MASLTLAGCSWLFGKDEPKPVVLPTTTVVFYLDRTFNEDQNLPVDLVFVGPKDNAKEVTAIGADQWFGQSKRDSWPNKQAVSLAPGAPLHQKVALQKPQDAQSLVILADYVNLEGGGGQQVVLGPDAKPEEVVFVTQKGIFH